MASKEKVKTFIESELEFTFGEGFKVIKFDEHPFYKALSGHGIKGVDFVAIHADWSLVLIEVKNYASYDEHESVPNDLFDVIKEKKSDSLRAIRIIYKMYRRKLLFRILNDSFFKDYLPRSWKFWSSANDMVTRGNYFFLAVIDHK